MHKTLIEFLIDQKILYKKKIGFQRRFSTAHAVISLIENIEKAIDNKLFLFVESLLTCKKHLIQLIITYCFINFHIMEQEI